MAALDDYLQCAIHLDYYHKPKRMPDCEHVYCLECIQQLYTNDGEMKVEAECPECRRTQRLPAGGVAALKTDLKLQGIIDDLSCRDCHSVKHSVTMCDSCKKNLCSVCAATHRSPISCSFSLKVGQIKNVLMGGNYENQKSNAESFLMNLNSEVEKKRKEINSKIDLEIKQLYCLKKTANRELDCILAKREKRLKNVGVAKKIEDQISDYEKMITKGNKGKMKKALPVIDKIHKVMTDHDLFSTEDVFEKYDSYASFVDNSQMAVFDYKSRQHCLSKGHEISCLTRPNHLCLDPSDDSMYVCDKDRRIHCKWQRSDLSLTVRDCLRDNISIDNFLIHICGGGETIMVIRPLLSDDVLVVMGTSVLSELPIGPCYLTAIASFHASASNIIVYFSTKKLIYRYNIQRKESCFKRSADVAVADYDVFVRGRQCISDLAVGVDGRVYVVDSEDCAVFVYSQSGVLNKTVSTAGSTDLNKPLSICLDGFGWILIADQGNQCIHVYDANFNHYIDIRDATRPFKVPVRVRVDKKKRICVLDQGRKELMVF